MKSVIIPIAGGDPTEPPPLLDGSNLSARIASITDGRSILRIIKDDDNHLDIGATHKAFIVSEQYEKKDFHLKSAVSLEEAVALVQRYEKESVADASQWYPTLIGGKNLRFTRPRLFALLNERYRVSNPLVIGGLILTAVMVIGGCAALGSILGTRTWLIQLPFGFYGILVAKRIDFVDPAAKRYGYSG